MMLCPCESGQPYSKCCGVYHAGDAAPTAAALMRSRYSAYALIHQNPGLEHYLLQTWHPDTRPQSLHFEDADSQRWLGLTVKRHQILDAEHAIVEFIARYKTLGNRGGRAERMHETSRFMRLDRRWYYVDGDHH